MVTSIFLITKPWSYDTVANPIHTCPNSWAYKNVEFSKLRRNILDLNNQDNIFVTEDEAWSMSTSNVGNYWKNHVIYLRTRWCPSMCMYCTLNNDYWSTNTSKLTISYAGHTCDKTSAPKYQTSLNIQPLHFSKCIIFKFLPSFQTLENELIKICPKT